MSEQESQAKNLTSTNPYLLRAIYQWVLDNSLTPQILVAVNFPGVEAPLDFAQDGKIVFNLHPKSVNGLDMGNKYVLFSARFGSQVADITIPIAAIEAIYARENGRGIMFQIEQIEYTQSCSGSLNSAQAEIKSKARLHLIK